MPGKLCVGQATNNSGAALLSSSKAYCEGMLYRSGGTVLERPEADNPHDDGSEDSEAWVLGWTLANTYSGGSIPEDEYGCCAPVGAIPA